MREPRGAEAADRLSRLGGVPGRRPVLSGDGWVPAPDDDPDPFPAAAQAHRADVEDASDDGLPDVVEGARAPRTVLPRLVIPRVAAPRLATPRRAALVALALGLALAAGAGARVLLSDAGREVPSGEVSARAVAARTGSPAPRSSGSGGAAAGRVVVAGSLAATASTVVVDVVGKVRSPGVVRLPMGSRVTDAVAAAGGVVAGAAVQRINLARTLVDGEQVTVPGPRDLLTGADASGGGSGAPGSGSAGSAGAPLDLNTATVAQLDGLPGVGPVTAQRIVAWRTQHGRFSRVEELGEVDGVGPKMLDRLKALVRV